jgi:mono/diheme cytochrome c family protein
MSLPAPRHLTQARRHPPLLPNAGHDKRRALAALLSLFLFGLGRTALAADLPFKDLPHLRRPVAAAWLEEGKLLAVANQRSGTISIVDIARRKVLDEVAVGERLADVADLPSAGWFLAVDEKRHELLVLQWARGTLEVAERLAVSHYPVNIAISPDGSRCTVASLWSRTITTFGIAPARRPAAPTFTKLNELVLGFAPSAQICLPDGQHVVVADAFGGRMALIDVTTQDVVHIPATDIFRIYGMALNFDRGGLYVGHQALKPLGGRYQTAVIVQNKGNPSVKRLANIVGEFSIEGLLQGKLEPFAVKGDAPQKPLPFKGDLRQMAEFAPALLTITTQGTRPGLVPAEGQPRVLVRRFEDELTVSDPDRPTKETTIKLGPVGTLTPADRGEALFYDTSLSANGWMSCNACHPDGHTTGQLADTLGDGTKGTHKRILTLLGIGETGKWAWNGEMPSLKTQVRKSLETTLGHKHTTPQEVNDITAFLQTLPPPPPLEPATDDPADQAQLSRGEVLFHDLGCVNCHFPPHYTSPGAYDVGLRDEKGMKKFNPPSLRGVSQGYSFFHDGRAKQLEEVFTEHGHQLERALADEQLADLLRFLRSL